MRLRPAWLGSFLIVRMTAPLASVTVTVTAFAESLSDVRDDRAVRRVLARPGAVAEVAVAIREVPAGRGADVEHGHVAA